MAFYSVIYAFSSVVCSLYNSSSMCIRTDDTGAGAIVRSVSCVLFYEIEKQDVESAGIYLYFICVCGHTFSGFSKGS